MFFPIQEDFSAGQISSRLFGKTNSPWYKKGVAYSENWLHLPQGPIRLRAGSQFLILAHANGPIRLIPFNLAVGQDYCLELGPGYVRVLSESGPLQEQGPETVVNGSFTAGMVPWVTTAGAIPGSVVYTFNGSTQQVVMTTWQNITIQVPNGHGGFMPYHQPPPSQPHFQQTITGIAAGNYDFSYGFGIGTTVTVKITDIASSSVIYTNTGSNITVTSVAVTIGASGVIIEFLGQAGGVYDQSAVVQGPISFRATGGGPALITGLPWTAAMLPYIQYAQDVSQGMFLVHPLLPPYQIQYDTTTGAFTAVDVAIYYQGF